MEIPIVRRAATSVALRPIRSPRWPNSAAPIGRAINAIAKVAKDWSTAALPIPAGKTGEGKQSLRQSHRYKNQNSIVVPTRLANKTRALELVATSVVAAVVVDDAMGNLTLRKNKY